MIKRSEGCFVLLLFFVFVLPLAAQDAPEKYWIYFTHKDVFTLQKSSDPVSAAQSIGISDRALKRRAKVMKPTDVLTAEDLPVSQSYINILTENGIIIENQSRWFNAVSAYLTEQQLRNIAALPFIKHIETVRIFKRKELPPVESSLQRYSQSHGTSRFSYGQSFAQMNQINAIAVHNIGISGRGVLVGMLDTGFRWKVHEALQNLNVIAEYDFIQKDTVTSNENGDIFSQDSHGTSTFSLVGGFKEGQLVSPAINASFMLGKTENVPSETNVEEDNWVAAIEWMEQRGVDVVSSSLGYNLFDAGQNSYTYSQMDGRTAITTKAAVIAARKGVVVVTVMGNEANTSWHFLISPADADSIISVGAVNSTGNYAAFSSVGPTSDGRTKPDVVALGVGIYCAVPSKTRYTASQGTSLSTPLVAGVAALLLSARPELTPIQVRDALRNTASNSAQPNNTIGWGIVDAFKALLYHGMVISTDADITLTTDSNYSIGMYVASPNPILKDSVKLLYTTNDGTTFSSVAMMLSEITDSTTHSGKYSAVIHGITSETDLQFYVRAMDNTLSARTSPYGAPMELFNAKTGSPNIPSSPPIPSTFVLEQNYPNPFNPGTVIRYHVPVTDFVSLKVYDVLGKEVATLVNEEKPAGIYSTPFLATRLATGVYFYRLQTTTFSQTKKMILQK